MIHIIFFCLLLFQNIFASEKQQEMEKEARRVEAIILDSTRSNQLIIPPELIDAKDEHYRSPLSAALREGDRDLVLSLLRQGANVNEPTFPPAQHLWCSSPLSLCIQHMPDLFDEFCSRGAELIWHEKKEILRKFIPRYGYATSRWDDRIKLNMVYKKMTLAIKAGAEVDGRWSSYTWLMDLVQDDFDSSNLNLHFIALLLINGADINARDLGMPNSKPNPNAKRAIDFAKTPQVKQMLENAWVLPAINEARANSRASLLSVLPRELSKLLSELIIWADIDRTTIGVSQKKSKS